MEGPAYKRALGLVRNARKRLSAGAGSRDSVLVHGFENATVKTGEANSKGGIGPFDLIQNELQLKAAVIPPRHEEV